MRLASCVSVEVVNGGAGRSTPGFSSTAVTVQGRFRHSASTSARPSASDSTRALRPVSVACRVEVLAGRDALGAEARERGRELTPFAREPGFEIPVRRRPECQARFLAIDNQPHRHALHAAGAQSRAHFLPQHRRHGVAVQAIEDAAAFLRAHQVLVHVVRILDGLLDRVFGDFVKDDALDRNLRLEDLLQMPADRLALAIGVGGEEDFGGALQRGLQRLHVFSLVVGDDVVGREVAVGVDAEPAPFLLADFVGNLVGRFRQVADVPVARPHVVAGLQNALDRTRLGGRFDNHQCSRHSRSP